MATRRVPPRPVVDAPATWVASGGRERARRQAAATKRSAAVSATQKIERKRAPARVTSPRLERVAEAVADAAEREDAEHDREAGRGDETEPRSEVGLGLVEHPAPGGARRLDADGQVFRARPRRASSGFDHRRRDARGPRVASSVAGRHVASDQAKRLAPSAREAVTKSSARVSKRLRAHDPRGRRSTPRDRGRGSSRPYRCARPPRRWRSRTEETAGPAGRR